MSSVAYERSMIPECWLSDEPGTGKTNHGQVFTRKWVVEMILDLAGYKSERDLGEKLALEPACGSGAFLVPMAERLVASCHLHGRSVMDAADAIIAVDLQHHNVELARKSVREALMDGGVSSTEATTLVEAWIRQADFILDTDHNGVADFVVGNPPYVRLEEVPTGRSAAYRRRCPTMGGRADLFVGFFEVGLKALVHGGALGFICADRWMRNQYGRRLRALISEHFALAATVVMHDVNAFEEQVSAYPAITIIKRERQGVTLTADTTAAFGPSEAKSLLDWSAHPDEARKAPITDLTFKAAVVAGLELGAESWPGGTPEELAVVADLEARFPRLEASAPGTKVGIGVATGADSVFVTTNPNLVEKDRLLPLSMVRDTSGGQLEWSGHYLVNPWSPNGGLVELDQYPRLRAYLELHADGLRRRHVAGKRPDAWFRTIDAVNHSLTSKPKLLLPDMKMRISPVLEDSDLYPHHNLYFVVSDGWNIRVLGGLLLSAVAEVFIKAYAVKMRGGTLRFQAQYLRRICVPRPADIKAADQEALQSAFDRRDRAAATEIAIRLYGLDPRAPIWGCDDGGS